MFGMPLIQLLNKFVETCIGRGGGGGGQIVYLATQHYIKTCLLLQPTIQAKAGSMLMYCVSPLLSWVSILTPTYMMGRFLPSTVSPLLSETSSIDYIAIKIGKNSRKVYV